MKPLKAIVHATSKVPAPVYQHPVPEIDQLRWAALRNIILQARMAFDQQIPDDKIVGQMIISWNMILRRIPTEYLEPALQFAIENYTGFGKMNCALIYRAFRDLRLRQKNAGLYQLPGPRTSPPKEYYALLAKIGIFPQPAAAPEKVALKKLRPQYKIEIGRASCRERV